MTILEQIEKEKQLIARCEKNLAMEKLKKRKVDTRRKIELGGLVIKAKMDGFSKSIVLGALLHIRSLIDEDEEYKTLLEHRGDQEFLHFKLADKMSYG
ncbi:conjugal transfer protein TraD [Legionella pneumophila serogroup 10]